MRDITLRAPAGISSVTTPKGAFVVDGSGLLVVPSSMLSELTEAGFTVYKDDAGLWDDLRMVSSARTVGANPATMDQFRGNARAWQFANNQMNELFLQAQLPHRYKEGTDLQLHVHWGHTSATDDGAVVWQAEVTWANVGEEMPAPTLYAAPPDLVLGAHRYHQDIASIVTLPGAGKKVSSIMSIRLFRDPAHASDTVASAGVFLFEVDAHFLTENQGSINPMRKP